MRIDINPPPNVLQHTPASPASVTLVASNDAEHTLLLALVAACSGNFPGVLNRALNQIAIDVMKVNSDANTPPKRRGRPRGWRKPK